eukprot:2776499-Pyramimonas_sp.AAC.1
MPCSLGVRVETSDPRTALASLQLQGRAPPWSAEATACLMESALAPPRAASRRRQRASSRGPLVERMLGRPWMSLMTQTMMALLHLAITLLAPM